jgi:hypothetical protein
MSLKGRVQVVFNSHEHQLEVAVVRGFSIYWTTIPVGGAAAVLNGSKVTLGCTTCDAHHEYYVDAVKQGTLDVAAYKGFKRMTKPITAADWQKVGVSALAHVL